MSAVCLRTQTVGIKAQLLVLSDGHVLENYSFLAQILLGLSQKIMRGGESNRGVGVKG